MTIKRIAFIFCIFLVFFTTTSYPMFKVVGDFFGSFFMGSDSTATMTQQPEEESLDILISSKTENLQEKITEIDARIIAVKHDVANNVITKADGIQKLKPLIKLKTTYQTNLETITSGYRNVTAVNRTIATTKKRQRDSSVENETKDASTTENTQPSKRIKTSNAGNQLLSETDTFLLAELQNQNNILDHVETKIAAEEELELLEELEELMKKNGNEDLYQ